MPQRILIVTLPPFEGGVPAKTRILAEELLKRGHQVTIAYYATLSGDPKLSPPLLSLRRPGSASRRCFDDRFHSVAVGCWAPELEFSYYRPSRFWNDLISRHDRHIAVGGTVLVSNPLHAAGIPHLVWCASDMLGDRLARRQAMGMPRRLLDRLLIGPVQARMERRILAGPGRIITVAQHARTMFAALGFALDRFGHMPIPTDPAQFSPADPAAPGIVGFAGRANDPRKNLPLLIRAVATARSHDDRIRLRLTGIPDKTTSAMIRTLGAESFIEWTGHLPFDRLPDFYRSLDVFAIPSSQEGFGIVGIEAMACGIPVISTRCGGPEDYVHPGQTGILVDHNAEQMAAALVQLIADRRLRQDMAQAARVLAETEYSPTRFRATLQTHWRMVWGEDP